MLFSGQAALCKHETVYFEKARFIVKLWRSSERTTPCDGTA